jgi:hypothetical protein
MLMSYINILLTHPVLFKIKQYPALHNKMSQVFFANTQDKIFFVIPFYLQSEQVHTAECVKIR